MENKNEIIEIFQYPERESWIQALQKSPPDSWIKTRELGGGKTSKYIPLGIQQALADKFFRECDVVEENYQVIVNEILCTVKISILPDYPYSEHRFITGTGSKPIQMDSGSTASKFPIGKKTNSLEYNAPAARAAAMSNAFTTFANLFGRNLSREMQSNFSLIRNKTEENAGN